MVDRGVWLYNPSLDEGVFDFFSSVLRGYENLGGEGMGFIMGSLAFMRGIWGF